MCTNKKLKIKKFRRCISVVSPIWRRYGSWKESRWHIILLVGIKHEQLKLKLRFLRAIIELLLVLLFYDHCSYLFFNWQINFFYTYCYSMPILTILRKTLCSCVKMHKFIMKKLLSYTKIPLFYNLYLRMRVNVSKRKAIIPTWMTKVLPLLL